MGMINWYLFMLILLPTNTECEKIGNKFRMDSFGILDNLINKTLEIMKPNLANIQIPFGSFETGPQEIGMLGGHIREVIVQNLEKLTVTIVNTTFFDINNLTIVENNFVAKGFYYINGTLAFPLGKKDIHFYGDGEFSAEFTNFSISMRLKIRYENGKKIIKDLELIAGLEKLNVHFKNLMGGGDLEEVFNKLMNDVGLTVFNYYKEPFLNDLKTQVKKFITEMLNANESFEISTISNRKSFNEMVLKSFNEPFPSSNLKHNFLHNLH